MADPRRGAMPGGPDPTITVVSLSRHPGRLWPVHEHKRVALRRFALDPYALDLLAILIMILLVLSAFVAHRRGLGHVAALAVGLLVIVILVGGVSALAGWSL